MSTSDDATDSEPLLAHDKRTLAEQYEKSDIAVAYITERLEWYGFDVEHVGRDDRHNDDTPVYGGMPDLKISGIKDDAVCGYIEVKAKSQQYANWMGRLNKHQWEKYLGGCTIEYDDGSEEWPGARELSIPIFVAMVCVDDNESTVTEEFYIPVHSNDQIEYEFDAQGGKKRVVTIDEEHHRSWDDMYITLCESDHNALP